MKQMELPNLSGAAESGNIGMGVTYRVPTGGKEMNICSATDKVKYYYFADGLLVFAGQGATKTLDNGGYLGPVHVLPAPRPWTKQVEEGTRRLVVCEGVTSVGSGLLCSLKGLEEVYLADTVAEFHQTDCPGAKVL